MLSKMKIAAAAILMTSGLVAAPALADVIYSDDFSSYAGTPSAQQQTDTGLNIALDGVLSNWNSAGSNAIFGVDRTGAGDWAVMFLNDSIGGTSIIELAHGIAANTLGTNYVVAFEGAPANFSKRGSETQAGDGLMFTVLDQFNAVIFSYLYNPATWPGTPDNPFSPASFTYAGTGNGNVTFSIFGVGNNGHFGGAIDNFSVDVAPAPEPGALALLGLGAGLIGLSRRRRKV